MIFPLFLIVLYLFFFSKSQSFPLTSNSQKDLVELETKQEKKGVNERKICFSGLLVFILGFPNIYLWF